MTRYSRKYCRKSGSNNDVNRCYALRKKVMIYENCEDYQFTGEGDPGIYEESNEQPT